MPKTKKTTKPKNPNIKLDGMFNVVTSLGIPGKARTPASKITNPQIFTMPELGNMYAGDGFPKKIIDLIAEEMTREWFSLNGDQDGILLKYLENLEAQQSIANLIRWAKLFGGAIIIIGANDGQNLEDELNLSNIKTIEFLRVIDRSEIFIDSKDRYLDPLDPKFGQVEFYTINSDIIGTASSKSLQYKVHDSRVLRLDGEVVPDFMKRANGGWGFSLIQIIYSQLINMLQGYDYASELIHDFLVNIFSIKNLSNILQTANGEERIKKRMEIVNYSKSALNAVIIEAGTESYDKNTTNVTGLTDLITKFEMALASVTHIPYMILTGKSPSGLSATGDNEVRAWYDRVSMMQEQQIKPLIKRLVDIISLSQDCTFTGNIEDVTIEFKPLWQYEQKDVVTMRLQQAQTDAIYLERGVLEDIEVRNSRFGDNYSYDTKLEEGVDITASNENDELKAQIEQMKNIINMQGNFSNNSNNSNNPDNTNNSSQEEDDEND